MEELWPYHIQTFTLLPPVECYEDGSKRKIKNYNRLSGIVDILDAINQERPVVIGVDLYDEFEQLDACNATLQSPAKDQSPSGAHALCLIGYDLDRRVLLCRNSFGEEWGLGGYFWMTFEYAEREMIDAWVFDIDLFEH
jgi:C1A family cysteine protease